MLCGQLFASCDLGETHLLDSDEEGRPRRARRTSEGTQTCPGQVTQETRGGVILKRVGTPFGGRRGTRLLGFGANATRRKELESRD